MPKTPELLLASRHDQLAALVERFLLTEDMGSHRLTSARFRLAVRHEVGEGR